MIDMSRDLPKGIDPNMYPEVLDPVLMVLGEPLSAEDRNQISWKDYRFGEVATGEGITTESRWLITCVRHRKTNVIEYWIVSNAYGFRDWWRWRDNQVITMIRLCGFDKPFYK